MMMPTQRPLLIHRKKKNKNKIQKKKPNRKSVHKIGKKKAKSNDIFSFRTEHPLSKNVLAKYLFFFLR